MPLPSAYGSLHNCAGGHTNEEGVLAQGLAEGLPGACHQLREHAQARSRLHDAQSHARHALHEAGGAHRHARAPPGAPLYCCGCLAPCLRQGVCW